MPPPRTLRRGDRSDRRLLALLGAGLTATVVTGLIGPLAQHHLQQLRFSPAAADPAASLPRRNPGDPRWSLVAGRSRSAPVLLPILQQPARASAGDGSGITVALVDSGIDLKRPELVARLWRHPQERPDGRDSDGNGLIDDLIGWDFVAGHGRPHDRFGHGTEMAGLILGAAPGAQLMVLRVLNERRRSDGRTVARAIDYARAHGARVINLSLISEQPSSEVSAAIARALAAGVQVVAATGNDGRHRPLFPARLPGVLAVGATSGSGERKPWSNGGGGKAGEVLGIPTDNLSTTQLGGGWTPVDGTSAAAALVSGHLARLSSTSSGRRVGIRDLLQQVPSVSLLR